MTAAPPTHPRSTPRVPGATDALDPRPTPRATPGIDDCAREPIHLSGAIQPHGYLVSVTLPDWTVCQASANIEALLEVPAAALLGESLTDFVNQDVLDVVADTVAFAEPDAPPQRAGTGNIGALGTLCDLGVHVADGLVHIEIEAQPFNQRGNAPTGVAQAMIARVAASSEFEDFHQRAAEQVRLLTGYDRVMVYRFRHDHAGEVIAEARTEEVEPYLGLRFPASDIPPQARALYLRNRLRVIPDAGYVPVPVVPGRTPQGMPLDMSQHALRSVSPVHLEYLRNMGVAASMSISIISGGRLWGLIACHHREPRAVPPGVRAAADLFGMFVSMRVAAREQEDTMRRYERAQLVRDAIGTRLSQAQAGDFATALSGELPLLQDVLDSDGAALWLDGRWHQAGRVPAALDVAPLLEWVERLGRPVLAMTDRAADWRTPALLAEGLAGVLAINMGTPQDWLFLFRREQVEDVRWAGEPAKALVTTDDGTRIAPRKSFAEWKQTVHGCSIDWSDSDRRGAERLHRVLREQRLRWLAPDPGDLDGQHRHQALRDQKARLQQLSGLIDGLVHLDASQSSQLDTGIATLETDLRRLIDGARDEALSGSR